MELVLKILSSIVVDDKHTLALGLCGLLLIGKLFLVDLDVVFLGKVAQGFGVGHLLVLHDKAHGASTFTTAKTVTELFGRRN